MWDAVGSFFAHLLAASNPLWWYYPLCAVVAVVYKATKHEEPRKIVLSSLHFFVSVSIGMFVLAVVFYAVQVLL
jgi:hypothetical protein